MGCEQLAQGCCAAALLPGFEPMTFQLRLPGYSNYTYNERLTLLNLPSLELRRLRLDLIWCYKILFGLISIDSADLFEVSQATATRGHPYKLFKPQCTINARSSFFTQRIINV